MPPVEYVGAIHVHTRFSDGGVDAESVVRIAGDVGLDYVVLSDHGTDAAREAGLVGWHGRGPRVLCASAPELGVRGQAHFLATGIEGPLPDHRAEPPEVLRQARDHGARNFIAHPHPARMSGFPRQPAGWQHWDTDAFAGIEIWSYIHDVCDLIFPWRVLSLRKHRRLVSGPRPETLALWDRLCRQRPVAGIGSLDNHATWLPLLGRTLPHADAFRTLRTHVVCDPLPENGHAAEKALFAALADGRSFVAMDAWTDARGFRFEAVGGERTASFGETVSADRRWTLRVRSPHPAEIRVLRDGETFHEVAGATEAEIPTDSPGVYRVEASVDRRPWVFTNPIYVRPGDDTADQAQPVDCGRRSES